MRDAAADADVPAGTAFNYRFIPAIGTREGADRRRRTRRDPTSSWAVPPRLAGRPRGAVGVADGRRHGTAPARSATGGAHTLDLADFLVGDEVGEIDRVSGHLQTFVDERPVYDEAGDVEEYRDVTVDDAYTAQVAYYESGAMGSFRGDPIRGRATRTTTRSKSTARRGA